MSIFFARGTIGAGIWCRNAFPLASTASGFQSTNNNAHGLLRSLVTITSSTTGTNNRKSSVNPTQFGISPTLMVARATRLASSSAPAAASKDSHGDHTKIWTAEKIVSGALLPIIPLAFIFPCNAMDYLLAFTITLHSHWGIEALVVDYVRPSVFGPVIPKIGVGAVWALSALTLGGLCYFTYTDVGIVNAIKMLWKL